ncbi:zinc ribbon domain-containing protein [Coraliomargarita akajimensis]|uniref:C4-type zinc ribbon domain-containing protein n=1 Tax=Coraliomargarita akajimensis (strain DSM 45221 / IAM 15411 / JCM 23193 / KCTC 12865 / 04OKA010-24) TaxID=583355 RepID=D5EJ60_CORAD|nr:C4-type zinc ribbon domain-containing protein [Coraliomargarita akajimensis]ADE54459.1 protein of unknown function DUF164 [Coraliomargarita akajimensis DSM 45221]
MPDPQIQKLLILQDRDVSLQKIEQELARIPQERSSIDGKISSEQANVEAARSNLKSMELQRSELDSEVQAKEATIERFRKQQLEVKKNDEYRALTQQIEQAQSEIGTLEEQEIEVLLEIDSLTETFEADKGEIELRIKDLQRLLGVLADKESNLKASVEAAQSELSAARADIDEDSLGHYDRVRKLVKRAPYIARIESHKCGGCHLRVSNEVSRDAMNAGELHYCDQCARIVYA